MRHNPSAVPRSSHGVAARLAAAARAVGAFVGWLLQREALQEPASKTAPAVGATQQQQQQQQQNKKQATLRWLLERETLPLASLRASAGKTSLLAWLFARETLPTPADRGGSNAAGQQSWWTFLFGAETLPQAQDTFGSARPQSLVSWLLSRERLPDRSDAGTDSGGRPSLKDQPLKDQPTEKKDDAGR